MRGLLADENVQGHLPYLRHLLEALDLWTVLVEAKLDFATFPDLTLPRGLDDRSLWNYCQQEGWVLFTENRNHDGPDSLHATLRRLMAVRPPSHLDALANKGKFEHSRSYAEHVASEVAELLFGVAMGQYREQARSFVPRQYLRLGDHLCSHPGSSWID